MRTNLRAGARVRKTQARWRFRPSVERLEIRLTPSGAPLVEPPLIASDPITHTLTTTLVQAQGTAQVGDVSVPNAWTYSGSYVGPTLAVKPGDLLNPTINNQLTEPTNLHTHGLHVSPEGNSDDVLLEIDPNQKQEFDIQLPMNQPQGLYWYHPHFHGDVNPQIAMGLSGLITVGDPDGGAPELAGITEHLLALKNAQIVNGLITDQSTEDPATQVFTVNGQLLPSLTMRPGELQIFNVANIGNNSFFTLQLQDQNKKAQTLYSVAEDGNPFFQVIQQTPGVALPPGRRWSFIIQGGQAGQTWTLLTNGFNDGFRQWPATPLMTITFQGTPAQPRTIPTTLSPNFPLYRDLRQVPASQIAQQRTVEFEQGPDPNTGQFVFEINGGEFPNNPVFQPQLGTIEEWTLLNPTTDDHPFHLHTNPQQVMSSSPGNNPNGLAQWTDVENVPHATNGVPGKVVIRVEFQDFTGSLVFHCHRVDHEDMGMMSLVNILPAQSITVTGAGAGGAPQVNVFNGSTGLILKSFNAFDPNFTGGVNVAVGDVNHDGVSDVLVAPGPGGGPEVKVYSGADYSILYDFNAFSPQFAGGVSLASGDVNTDGYDDIICGAGPGGGPNVVVYSGKTGALLQSFFAYDPKFSSGVTVAAGDLVGNARVLIVTGPGPGGGPQVNVFDRFSALQSSFLAFDANFTGGIFVATGRVRGIGFDSIIVGAGAGGGPQVEAFQTPSIHDMTGGGPPPGVPPLQFTQINSFFAFAPGFTGGVRVGSFDRPLGTNFLAGAGAGGGPTVGYYDGVTQQVLDSFFAYNQQFTGGISVAAN